MSTAELILVVDEQGENLSGILVVLVDASTFAIDRCGDESNKKDRENRENLNQHGHQ
ncbi:hypothetical protein [Bounagaea algeriensis]